MNIVMSFNDNFKFPFLVAIASLKKAMPKESIKLYLLVDSSQKFDKIRDFSSMLYKHFFIKTTPLRISPKIEDFLKTTIQSKENLNIYSINASYRLFIPWIIPEDRCLYLDSDVIVQRNIKDFYSQDFEGNLIVAREENFSNADYDDSVSKVINSGVVLFNLNKIRENSDLRRDLYKVCNQYNDYLFFDEYVLSKLYEGKIKFCDKKFNHSLIERDLAPYKNFKKSYILHFLGNKPWNTYKPDGKWKSYYWHKYMKNLVKYLKK